MKIAILYICTGNYIVFWKDFYLSSQKYFIPEAEKHYFVFTDSQSIDFKNSDQKINLIRQENLGWPDNTLQRFNMFLKAKEQLKDMDYIFFFNANLLFIKKISKEEFLPSNQETLMACIHPGFYKTTPDNFSYDRNPKSTAYIPFGSGYKYYAGGLNGGKAECFLKAITKMKENTEKDSENKTIALWHDESHWNKYIFENKPVLKELSPSYLYPEGYILPFEPKMILRDKGRLGSVNKLRGTTKKVMSIKQKIKLYTKAIYSNFLYKKFVIYDKIFYSHIAVKYIKNKRVFSEDTRKISVAITSFNRDKLIHKSLATIVGDNRISEIIILDDGSSNESFLRTKKIIDSFKSSKIKLFRRNENFGVLATKIESASLCSNDWVIALDSDNTLLPTYIDAIFSVSNWKNDTIYCPSFAYPLIDLRVFSGETICFDKTKDLFINQTNKVSLLINDGNFFLNRKEFGKIITEYKFYQVYASDVVFANYIWLSNQGKLSILPNCTYIHRIHKKSTWTKTSESSTKMFEQIKNKIIMSEKVNKNELENDIPIVVKTGKINKY